MKAYLRRGGSYIERKKFNRAKKDIDKALNIKPKEVNAHRMLKEIEI